MKKSNIVILLGFLAFIVMADNWVVSPILPAISQDIGTAVERAGLLIAAYMIPFGIFQILYGPLADRFGKKQVITLAIVLFTLATGLCAIGMGLTDLTVYRALTGMFAAAVMPTSLAFIGDIFPIQERQRAIGTFLGFAFMGQGLSMIIGGSISYLFSWRGVFAVYALLSLIPMILILKHYKALPDTKNADSRLFEPFLNLVRHRHSLFTYVMFLLEGLFIIGSFSYLGGYISETHQFNDLLIGVIMTVFALMTIVGGRLGGRPFLSAHPRIPLAGGLFLAMSANLLIHYAGGHLWGLIPGVGLLGLGFMLAHSLLLTRATEFAQHSRGAAMSLMAFNFMGGGGIGTAIGGKIAAAYGLSAIYLVYGLALAVTLALSFVLITGPVIPSRGTTQP